MTLPTTALTGDRLETGDTAACVDTASGKGTITHLEVFEYYEALELAQRTISLGDSSLDVWTRATTVAKRLESLDSGTYETTAAIIQLLKDGFRELPSAKLFGLPVTDTIVSLPQTCFLIQAAAVVGEPVIDGISMYVNASIWQTMNADQHSGIKLT